MADDEVPPLEDMSEMLATAARLRDNKAKWQHMRSGSEGERTTESRRDRTLETERDAKDGSGGPATSNSSREESRKQQVFKSQHAGSAGALASASDEFCGMKKGFLLGGGKKKKSKSQATASTTSQKESDIPYIKPTQTKNESRLLPEVQEMMKDAGKLLQGKEWITDDLLEKIKRNPVVGPKMSNSNFSEVLAGLQRNPEKILKECGDNAEMEAFMKEFCSILGDHFTKLGDKQKPSDKKTADSSQVKDEERMHKLLARPDVQEALSDPNIQHLITQLREHPDRAHQLLSHFSEDPNFRRRVHKLIELGVLGIAR